MGFRPTHDFGTVVPEAKATGFRPTHDFGTVVPDTMAAIPNIARRESVRYIFFERKNWRKRIMPMIRNKYSDCIEFHSLSKVL